jgi:hypothetical protein
VALFIERRGALREGGCEEEAGERLGEGEGFMEETLREVKGLWRKP